MKWNLEKRSTLFGWMLCGLWIGAAIGCSGSTTDSGKEKDKKAAAAPTNNDDASKDKTAGDGNADDSNAVAADTPKGRPAGADFEPAAVNLPDESLLDGIPGEGALAIEQIKAWLADDENHRPLEPSLPLGLSVGSSQISGVKENPLTRAKIELGRQLYFDTRLSSDRTISCASCHHPDTGYAANTPFGVGVDGQMGGRNSPVSFNRILSKAQFWDGRAADLEAQAVGPIANPIEMGNTHESCIECLKAIEGYCLQFDKVFGEMTIDAVGKALASFERAVVTNPSPYDYFEQLKRFESFDDQVMINGKLDDETLADLEEDEPDYFELYEKITAEVAEHPISESAIRGRQIFFTDKGRCQTCHVGANLTDELYHNIGIGMDKEKPDLGRFEVTGEEKDKGAFKTPTVRNVAQTGPYMHDGSVETLEEVVEWYAKGGHPNPHLSDKIVKLELSDQDKKDLVEFMKACTGEFPKVNRGRLPMD